MGKPVETHIFHGRRYKIDLQKFDGICDTYNLVESDRTLRIMVSLKTRNGLITAIHEALHAENWAATESVVERVSSEIGDFLWRLGYRKTK